MYFVAVHYDTPSNRSKERRGHVGIALFSCRAIPTVTSDNYAVVLMECKLSQPQMMKASSVSQV